MAIKYFVDHIAHSDGSHEVHADGCTLKPRTADCTFLGYHAFPQTALIKARGLYLRAHPCPYCAREWHSGLVQQGFLSARYG